MAEIKVNGRMYQVDEDITVLEVCRGIGIDIPTLCNDERLEPDTACRLCLVGVRGKLMTSIP